MTLKIYGTAASCAARPLWVAQELGLVYISPTGKCVCPNCGEWARRIPRRLRDRLLNPFRPVKRYRCDFCDWIASVPVNQVPDKKS